MRFAIVLVVLGATALGICPSAGAAIVGTSGQMVAIATPPDVRLGALESNTIIHVFPERQDVSLASKVAIDISLPGTVPTSAINLTPGFIPAGTRVDSFLIHFDVLGTPAQPISPSGSSSGVTFSAVLGIEVLGASLDNTDAALAAPSTLYPGGESLRGLELAVGQIGINTFDGINLSPDRKTVFVILSAQLSLDQIRIVTAVPEPPAAAMLVGAVSIAPLLCACRTRSRVPRRPPRLAQQHRPWQSPSSVSATA